MSDFKWLPCYVGFISQGSVILRKGKFHLGDLLIKCRMGFLSTPVVFVIAPHSFAYPFKKRILWFIGSDKVALGKIEGEKCPLSPKDYEELQMMLRVVGEDKWFKAMAGKALSWVDYLIIMGAGFGFFSLVVEVVKIVFAK